MIRTKYPTSIEECAAALPNRTRATIINRAKALGVKYDGNKRMLKCVELNTVYTLDEAQAQHKKTKGAFLHAAKTGGCCAGYHWKYVD